MLRESLGVPREDAGEEEPAKKKTKKDESQAGDHYETCQGFQFLKGTLKARHSSSGRSLG